MPKEPRVRKLTEKGLDYAMQKKAAEVAAEKRKLDRAEAVRMKGEIDELEEMFKGMKTSAPAAAAAPLDVEMDMAARGRRRKTRKSTKKAKKKSRKTRKH